MLMIMTKEEKQVAQVWIREHHIFLVGLSSKIVNIGVLGGWLGSIVAAIDLLAMCSTLCSQTIMERVEALAGGFTLFKWKVVEIQK